MALRNISDLVAAEESGRFWFSAWRKTPTQTTGAGIWFDLSMSPGNPVPNYYAASPNIAIALKQSTDGGIPHGGAVSPLKKHLKQFTAMTATATATPLPMILCDYLMFYPFVDMSITDEQPMDNTVTLPRSTSGVGVEIMPVEVAGQSGIGNPKFYVQYTNSDGVSGRITPTVACNTQVVNGTIITAAPNTAGSAGPFLPLQPGDRGVRSIEAVTFLTGDVGLISFVLVKPVENIAIRTIDAPAERVPFTDFCDLPVIEDDAYLNLICCPQGTLAGAPLHGTITTIWS
ncbi:MAG TPA: hypothetical protein PKY40_07735 [Burkholderiaceae bacterium]|nr:hypothetical protein [Burkholderiaceae bacterium]